MLEEVVDYLQIEPGGSYVDATIGGGGHGYYILEKSSPDGKLLGIDRDVNALDATAKKLHSFGNRVTLVHDNFKNIKKIFYLNGWSKVQGVLVDLGVSSPQIDNEKRGFSYMQDGPLDMRMNLSDEISAEDLVNNLSVEELKILIRKYGEEKWAARIAQFIATARIKERITSTGQLVEIISSAIPVKAREKKSHPAKRTFQALRIATNKELEGLEKAIEDIVDIVEPGGRIVVISFHSLEDRIIKNAFKYLASSCLCSSKIPVCVCDKKSTIKIITNKPIKATQEEVEINSRAKSAKLRVAEKLV